MKQSYTYIMTNEYNTTLYIGVTNDLIRRVYEHKNKLIDGFTKTYNLNKLVYFEQFDDIANAIEREKNLKNWHRNWKFNLIKEFNPEYNDLYNDILNDQYKSPPCNAESSLRHSNSSVRHSEPSPRHAELVSASQDPATLKQVQGDVELAKAHAEKLI